MYAMEQALEGNTSEAAAHFREVDPSGLSGYMHIQHRCVRGMLAVQQAEPEKRRKVFREEHEGIMRTVNQYAASAYRADYRRCIAKMEKDAKGC
jgi:hypothetical protein